MELFFKTALLVVTIMSSLNVTQISAAGIPKPDSAASVTINSKFKDDAEQSAYALGASLGQHMEKSLKEQEKLGIRLDKEQLIAGVQAAFSQKSILTEAEIEETLRRFESRIRAAATVRMDQEAKENTEKGNKYRFDFAKENGVKKTTSGLLYKIEKQGTGEAPKNSDTVTVNYKGTLTDGTEFDSSYARGEPLSFRLDGVIQGWKEGLKHVRKGGKITLVVPPELGYGKAGVPGIPANSTLVFDVELLGIKATAPKMDAKAQTAADEKVTSG